jgi:ubiquinone/menaquinone biosynthesis C-methylase UbiE
VFFHGRANSYYRDNYEDPRNRHALNLSLRRDACLALLSEVEDPVLDLGCGPGAMTAPLLERGRQVVAMDIATGMVTEVARRMAEVGAPPSVAVATATALPFADACFAAVVTTGVLEYVRDVDVAMGEIFRVLRPGGVLVCTMSLPRRVERAVVREVARLRGQPPGVQQYIYGRAAFDRVIENAGFVIEGRRCCSFAPFPIDAMWPRGLVWIDRLFGSMLNRVDLACDHAKTYIVRARR